MWRLASFLHALGFRVTVTRYAVAAGGSDGWEPRTPAKRTLRIEGWHGIW